VRAPRVRYSAIARPCSQSPLDIPSQIATKSEAHHSLYKGYKSPVDRSTSQLSVSSSGSFSNTDIYHALLVSLAYIPRPSTCVGGLCLQPATVPGTGSPGRHSAKAPRRSPTNAATDDTVRIDNHLCYVFSMYCGPFLTCEEYPCRQQATRPTRHSPRRHSAKPSCRSPTSAATDDNVRIDSHLCCVSDMYCSPVRNVPADSKPQGQPGIAQGAVEHKQRARAPQCSD